MKKCFILLVALFFNNLAWGQLNFDRTRIILDASKGDSQSIMVLNSSPTVPYLAQAWIENNKGEKISSPLVALPLLQRIEGNQEKQIRISLMGDHVSLNQNQESLYFFKVLGMPPKNDVGKNEMVIVVTSELKLFYRPKGLPQYSSPNGWVYDLEVSKSNKGFFYNNPTPYHMVLMGVENAGSKLKGKELIIKPFSKESVDMSVGNNFTLYFVGDMGEAVKVKYNCTSDGCTAS